MNKTEIEWVQNPDGSQGYTWNPITGCLNHKDGLCNGGGFPCYACKLAHGRLKAKYLDNNILAQPLRPSIYMNERGIEHYLHPYHDSFYPRFWAERIAKYFDGHKKPRGVFVCDMGELFGSWIPDAWQEQIFTVIKSFPDDRFYLLTKQPQNLLKWSPVPDNCWVGVTATSTRMAVEACLRLDEIEATVTYLSLEPMLNPINLPAQFLIDCKIDWIIIGAQTKPYKPPRIEWVEEIFQAADKAGIPVFLKDNLLELLNYVSLDTEFAFDKDGYFRQEMPGEIASGRNQCTKHA